MSIYNFSKDVFCRINNENETFDASIMLLPAGEISKLRFKVYKKGPVSGSVVVKIFPNNSSVAIATSAPVALSSIQDNFFGFISFDFNRENISNGYYRIEVSVSGYNGSSSGDFMSFIYDYPVGIYSDDLGGPLTNPLAIEVFYYK